MAIPLPAPPGPQPIWASLLAVYGLCVGSFVDMAISRWPERGGPGLLRQLSPPSACPHCAHRVRWYDNVPILGYLRLAGVCRDCGGPIGARTLAVEGVGLVAALVLAANGVVWRDPITLTVILWLTLTVGVTYRQHRVPRPLLAPLAALGLGLAFDPGAGFVTPVGALAGAAAGFFGLFVNRAGSDATITRIDALLAGVIGLFMGVIPTLLVIGAGVAVSVGVFPAMRHTPDSAASAVRAARPLAVYLAGLAIPALLLLALTRGGV